ncbi:MAG: acyltransferase 3 [Bacilli bacterium]|nr:acyltransferase 3 [Bacilli bacterium]
MAKGKILEFEIFRAFAILAVVMIHATSGGVVGLALKSKSHFLFQLLNTTAYFAVPSFIFMSGVVLFYSYYDKWRFKDILSFYVKRLKFIVIPYIVVSFLYYIFYQRLLTGTISIHPRYFLSLLPWADAGYHLYFIIIIVQFYLLFPLMMFFVKKFPQVKRHIILIGTVLFLSFYFVNKYYYAFPHRSSLFINYLIFFCLGAAIGMNYKEAIAKIQRYQFAVISIFLFSGIGLLTYNVLQDFNIKWSNYFYDFCFNVYGAFASLFLLWLSYRIQHKFSKISRQLIRLGGYSFGIYLIHPALLSTYLHYVNPTGGVELFILNFVVSFLIAFIGALILTVIIKRYIKYNWIFIGK